MSDSEKKGSVSKRSLHEIYCAFILLATIIILASVQWYRIDKLVELISFSLTITSLVLAVIAIGYSIFSGTSIERGVQQLLLAVQSVRSSASDIEGLRDTLTKEVRAVADAVGGVATTVTQQSSVLTKMAEEGANAKASPVVPVVRTADAKQLPTVRELLRGGSLVGSMGFLVVARCKELNRSINYAAAFKDTFVDIQYMHGYIVALSATGILNVEMTPDTINSVAGDLGMSATDIKAALLSKIETTTKPGPYQKQYQEELLVIDERLRGLPTPAAVSPTPPAPAAPPASPAPRA